MSKTITHIANFKYRPDIDGLRAIAVLSVLTFHTFPTWLNGGFIGVDIFFVISGFLISYNIFEALNNNEFSFYDFYTKRIRRIFPALILVLLSCLIFGWFLLIPDELNQLGKHVAASAGFISNFIFWSEAGYFDNDSKTKPLLHLWSLGIEEQFYIAWPLLLWTVWKIKLHPPIFIIALALFSFYLNFKYSSIDSIAAFYAPHTRFWELLCGSLLAWVIAFKASTYERLTFKFDTFILKFFRKKYLAIHHSITPNIITCAGIFLLLLGFFKINTNTNFLGKWAIIPVIGTTLIILAGPKAWINKKILSNRILVWFGLISFPLYLWHWPILSFARIIENDVPNITIRCSSLLASIFLGWITVIFFEKPFRFSANKVKFKLLVLCGTLISLGSIGIFFSKRDFTQTHGYENLIIYRKGFEHALGLSLSWYKGKNDWLFLGNAHDSTVAKLKLAITPGDSDIHSVKETFFKISQAASNFGTKLVLIIGPNKSSIYPEYLPEKIIPSKIKYINFFIAKLTEIPNLIIYDPTIDLLASKSSENILYWMTDTHWNNKGAFVAYSGFSKIINAPIPDVKFKHGSPHHGDLLNISKIKNFPLNSIDNWDVVWANNPRLIMEEIPNEQITTFGQPVIVTNEKAPSDQYVWVVGDSFAGSLKKYFNATFKKVRYVGHWSHKLNILPDELEKAKQKPDVIVIVRVERSF